MLKQLYEIFLIKIAKVEYSIFISFENTIK